MNKLVLFVLVLGLVACGGETTTTETKGSEPVAKVEQQDNNKTFGITPDQFGERFVKLAKENGLGNFKWEKVKLEQGAVNDTFSIPLSEGVVLTGVVSKNGELKSLIYVLGKSDKLVDELIGATFMAGLTARALSPDLPKEKTAGEMLKLINTTMDEFNKNGDVVKHTTFGKVDGFVSFNSTTGILIGFEAI